MKKILTLFLLINSINLSFSQENLKKCITTKLVKEEMLINKYYKFARENNNLLNLSKIKQSTITIPIVIHIIHRQNHSNIGTGTNISILQIEDGLRILNEDFSKTNPEAASPPRNTFSSYWGNPDLEFCLATIDPDGNSTSGITRTSSSQLNWDADDDSNDPCHESNGMKRTSCGGIDSWDPKRYLNIWICDLTNSQSGGMTLGYAYLPGLLANPFNTSDDYKDGLVVDYRYFGTNGIAAPSSDGRTATHEIGHYLGLFHTFCEESDNSGNPICCDNDNSNWGGNVDDTPATKDIYFGAVNSLTNNNTCNDLNYSNSFTTNVIDMDENFMAYSANTWMFSQSQVSVMLDVLGTTEANGGRRALKNSTVTTNCSGLISGISDINYINASIYPNPTSDNIYISSERKIISIDIINIIGEQVLHKKSEGNTSINLSMLDEGIYFIKVNSDKGFSTKKITLIR